VSNPAVVRNFGAIRWVAASLVVASHIHLEASRLGVETPLLSNAARFADLGVALFFVLSGWLMGRQTQSLATNFQRFLGRRAIRIVPLYFIVTVGVIAFQAFISRNIEPMHWLASILFLSQLSGQGHPVLYVGWTLEYEAFFYLLVASTLLLRNVAARFFVSIGTLLGLVLIGLLPQLTLFFAWGLVGSLIPSRRYMEYKSRAGLLAMFLTTVVTWQVMTGLNIYENVMVFGIEVSAIFYLLESTWQVRWRLVRVLGEASYAQYLVHVPVLTVVVALAAPKTSEIGLMVICFASALATSLAVWALVDRPLLKAASNVWSSP
jgi:exopolysaccharide production protein ExoZ